MERGKEASAGSRWECPDFDCASLRDLRESFALFAVEGFCLRNQDIILIEQLYRVTISIVGGQPKKSWIAARYNQRNEEAHFGRLSGAGGVPLSNPPLSS